MALTNRPIIPKNPKVRNKPFVDLYRYDNPNCEVCLLDGLIISRDDIHHIIPGLRLDLIWNIISLCRNHHICATEHINGNEAKKFNMLLFAIKYLKNEITDKKLLELEIIEQVLLAASFIEDKFNKYKRGQL